MTSRVPVALGERSYDILIGDRLIETAADHVRPVLRGAQCVIVTDENVAPLHLPPLRASLSNAGVATAEVVLKSGEQTKSFAELEALLDLLLAQGVDRKTTLIALGGGVIGDLVGVTASLLLRGVDFIQVPTTLLAQVDSSVGGKTAINTKHGKNLVGSFYQPRLVLADVAALNSLPRRELLAGYAETVKYGLIDDPDFFKWCETNGPAVVDGQSAAMTHAVETSCRAKARIVAADEREAGQRALLNLGHTFGHAFESAMGYGGGLLHGEAVAIGCCMAYELSAQLGLCPAADAARVRRHFAANGLPTGLPAAGADWQPDQLIDLMLKDKKASGGRHVFILSRGIGQAFVANDVPLENVRRLLDDAISAAKA